MCRSFGVQIIPSIIKEQVCDRDFDFLICVFFLVLFCFFLFFFGFGFGGDLELVVCNFCIDV